MWRSSAGPSPGPAWPPDGVRRPTRARRSGHNAQRWARASRPAGTPSDSGGPRSAGPAGSSPSGSARTARPDTSGSAPSDRPRPAGRRTSDHSCRTGRSPRPSGVRRRRRRRGRRNCPARSRRRWSLRRPSGSSSFPPAGRRWPSPASPGRRRCRSLRPRRRAPCREGWPGPDAPKDWGRRPSAGPGRPRHGAPRRRCR